MRMVCEFPVGTFRPNVVTVNDAVAVGKTLRTMPGVGKPFLIFDGAVYNGLAVGADFGLHTDWAGHGNVVNSDPAKNTEMINAMLANPPLDALLFAE